MLYECVLHVTCSLNQSSHAASIRVQYMRVLYVCIRPRAMQIILLANRTLTRTGDSNYVPEYSYQCACRLQLTEFVFIITRFLIELSYYGYCRSKKIFLS